MPTRRQSWLRRNPLRLGISSDAVGLIQDQLRRGSADRASRLRALAHIVVELAVVPGVPATLLDLTGAATELAADATGAVAAATSDDVEGTAKIEGAAEAAKAAGYQYEGRRFDATWRNPLVLVISKKKPRLFRGFRGGRYWI